MAASCTTFTNLPPLPVHSPACPPTKKVAVVETTAAIKEIAEGDKDRVIGRLSQEKYNLDF